MAHEHRYRTELSWEGSTGIGYEAYSRDHQLSAPPVAAALDLSADAGFRGDPARLNPEQLLVAAASSCQLLSFLAVAARARIDVIEYTDHAEAVMPEHDKPVRITRISLRPAITLGPGSTHQTDDRLARLVEVAHRECFIANSLRSAVDVVATFLRL